MARKKLEERSVRKLQKSRGSYHTSIPIEIIRKLKWKSGQKIVIKKYGRNKIIIEDWPIRRAQDEKK